MVGSRDAWSSEYGQREAGEMGRMVLDREFSGRICGVAIQEDCGRNHGRRKQGDREPRAWTWCMGQGLEESGKGA